MLINDKFEQFKDLINACNENTYDTKITLNDLQGFWDLVYIQVEDVVTKFNYLEKLKQNKWQVTDEIVSKASTCGKPHVQEIKKKRISDKEHKKAARLRVEAAKLTFKRRFHTSKDDKSSL